MTYWTDPARTARLRAMVAEARSGGQIAKELSREFEQITRCAVIGRARRLGLALTFRPAPAGRNHGGRPRKPPPPMAKQPPWRPLPPPVVEHVNQDRPSLFELAPSGCHWPIGDPQHPQFHFCGQARQHGRPYCAAHWAEAWRKS